MTIRQPSSQFNRVPLWVLGVLGVGIALAIACSSGESAASVVPTVAAASPTSSPPLATAIATPTLTPPTATPEAVPTAAATVVSTDTDPLGAQALEYVETLSVDLSPRTSASAGELAAAEYLQDRMAALGYQAELQEFEFDFLEQEGDFIHLVGPDESAMSARMISGSSGGTAEGLLVDIGLGGITDIPFEGLAGAIAFADRGIIPFETKARNAERAGAIAIIVANNFPDPISATFERRFDFVAVTVSGVDGDEIRALMDEGDVSVRLDVAPQVLQSRNVVATLLGSTDDIVIMGAHFDAVDGSPGANDNASGVATVLTIAEQIAEEDLPFELRIVFFGAEELGLLGSQHYLSSLTPDEADRVAFMLNLDALGSGQLEIVGDIGLIAAAQDVASDLGISVQRGVIPANSSSDHASFEAAGIPILMFFGSDFTEIHTPQDALDTIEPEILGDAAAIVIEGLSGQFAESLSLKAASGAF